MTLAEICDQRLLIAGGFVIVESVTLMLILALLCRHAIMRRLALPIRLVVLGSCVRTVRLGLMGRLTLIIRLAVLTCCALTERLGILGSLAIMGRIVIVGSLAVSMRQVLIRSVAYLTSGGVLHF